MIYLKRKNKRDREREEERVKLLKLLFILAETQFDFCHFLLPKSKKEQNLTKIKIKN